MRVRKPRRGRGRGGEGEGVGVVGVRRAMDLGVRGLGAVLVQAVRGGTASVVDGVDVSEDCVGAIGALLNIALQPRTLVVLVGNEQEQNSPCNELQKMPGIFWRIFDDIDRCPTRDQSCQLFLTTTFRRGRKGVGHELVT